MPLAPASQSPSLHFCPTQTSGKGIQSPNLPLLGALQGCFLKLKFDTHPHTHKPVFAAPFAITLACPEASLHLDRGIDLTLPTPTLLHPCPFHPLPSYTSSSKAPLKCSSSTQSLRTLSPFSTCIKPSRPRPCLLIPPHLTILHLTITPL